MLKTSENHFQRRDDDHQNNDEHSEPVLVQRRLNHCATASAFCE